MVLWCPFKCHCSAFSLAPPLQPQTFLRKHAKGKQHARGPRYRNDFLRYSSKEQAQRLDRGPEGGQGLVLNQCSHSTLARPFVTFQVIKSIYICLLGPFVPWHIYYMGDFYSAIIPNTPCDLDQNLLQQVSHYYHPPLILHLT